MSDTGSSRPLLELRRLESYLDRHGFGTGRLGAEPIGDGHSNLTYRIRRNGGEWVLRRPPHGPLPPSAHDVLREFRILTACARTQVRAPEPLLACSDETVIGAPFYLMGYVAGQVLTTSLPEGHDPSSVVDELVGALVEIHAVDWRAAGLGDFAPAPEAYVERQLRRFTRLWDHNRTRELPVVEQVGAWLARNRPAAGDVTVVHGDYRLGNTIFSYSPPPRLQAVLDWEMATIGDPLADVGYLSATYAVPGESTDPLVRLGSVTASTGFPGRGDLVERYARASGRDVEGLRFYEVLALWKSAILLEGSYARLLSGATSDGFFAELKTGVPELAERAAVLTSC